jgi:amino acid permease
MDAGVAEEDGEEAPAFDVCIDWLKAVFTTVKCNWGIGMMAMPYLLLQSGFGAGIILFILAMWLSWLAIVRLSDCRKILRERGLDTLSLLTEKSDGARQQLLDDGEAVSLVNYSDIVRAVLGDFYGDASIVSILIAMYGSNIAYIVWIKENLAKFVGLQGFEWVLIAFVPLTLLVLRSDLEFLARVSVFGIICAVSFLSLLVYHTAEDLSMPQFNDIIQNDASFLSLSTLPIGIGIASFCNEGIVVMSPTIEEGMKWKRNYRSALLASVISLTLIYLLFAICGYALYFHASDGIQGALSMNFEVTNLNRAAVILYALQLIMTYALVYFVCYNEVENRYYSSRHILTGSDEHKERHKHFLVLRVLFMLLSGVIALLVPQFGDFLALLGSLGNSLSIYILPNLCYLKLHADPTASQVRYTVDTAFRTA